MVWCVWCVWCVCGVCGGGGSDGAITEMSLSISLHACNEFGWQNTWESRLPASPPPWPSRPAGRRAKNASKKRQKRPFQSVSILSMNGSEPRPGTVGNLSLHEHSDDHNRAGTAPAAPPGNSALSGPSGTCCAQQRARQQSIQELHCGVTFTCEILPIAS